MLPDSLIKQFHTPALRALFAPPPGPENEGYEASLRRQAEAFAPPVVILIYHALADLFVQCPDVKWVKPVWEPSISRGDKAFRLEFVLEMGCLDAKAVLEKAYRYGDCPTSWTPAQQACFADAVEAGEQIGLDMWNCIRQAVIAEKVKYTSVAEIEQEMEREFGPVLAKLRKWDMERQLPEARAQAPAQRM